LSSLSITEEDLNNEIKGLKESGHITENATEEEARKRASGQIYYDRLTAIKEISKLFDPVCSTRCKIVSAFGCFAFVAFIVLQAYYS
jgi:hypothetical protein